MPKTSPTAEAHRTRTERAEILQEVERGTRYIVDLIYKPPASLGGADLYPVLMRVPSLGRRGVEHVCSRARVWPHRTLDDLTENERLRLVTCLPARCKK